MKKYNYNISAFTNEDSISYYLLGAFLADGWIDKGRNRICFASTDYDWILKIRDIVCKDLYIRTRKTKAKDIYNIAINEKSIHTWFLDKGFTTEKSLNIKCPYVPDKFFLDFFLGCVDGDGFISFYKNKVPILGISSGSKDFLDIIRFKLSLFGIICNVYKKFKPEKQLIMNIECKVINDHFFIKIYGRKVLKLINMLHSNNVPFLNRKKIIADQIIDYYSIKDKGK